MNKHDKEIAEIRALLAESDRLRIKSQKDFEARQKKYEKDRDISRKENEKRKAELDAQIKETSAGIAELRKQVNGISDSNGMFSEEYFINTLGKSFRFCGVNFDEINNGMSRKKKLPNGTRIEGEYDIVMVNGDTVALIEIKYRVRKSDVSDLINRRIKQFKTLYSEYEKYKFYLGLAGMTFERGSKAEAIKYGVGLLLPKGENVKIIDAHAREY